MGDILTREDAQKYIDNFSFEPSFALQFAKTALFYMDKCAEMENMSAEWCEKWTDACHEILSLTKEIKRLKKEGSE